MPKASSLKAEIEQKFPDAQIELIEGGKGVFDVKKDGELIFSKYKTNRFPQPGEVTENL